MLYILLWNLLSLNTILWMYFHTSTYYFQTLFQMDAQYSIIWICHSLLHQASTFKALNIPIFFILFSNVATSETVLQTQLQKQLNVYIYSKLLPSELIGKLVISSSVLTELAPVAIFLIMEKSKIHKLLSHLQHRKIQHNAAERHPERVIMHSQTPSGS